MHHAYYRNWMAINLYLLAGVLLQILSVHVVVVLAASSLPSPSPQISSSSLATLPRRSCTSTMKRATFNSSFTTATNAARRMMQPSSHRRRVGRRQLVVLFQNHDIFVRHHHIVGHTPPHHCQHPRSRTTTATTTAIDIIMQVKDETSTIKSFDPMYMSSFKPTNGDGMMVGRSKDDTIASSDAINHQNASPSSTRMSPYERMVMDLFQATTMDSNDDENKIMTVDCFKKEHY